MSVRVAVVTGGNKGIGFAVVRALCKQFDGDVYLTARDEERGKQAVKELEAEGLHPKFHVLDINDPKSVDTLKDYLVKNYGGVDVLVHNAAIAFKGKDPTPFGKQAAVTVATNYTSSVYLCNAILPVMKAQGRISILASIVAEWSLKKCSEKNQSLFKSPDITEEQLTKIMEEFVEAADAGTHESLGFANTAYGMSKVGVLVLTRILAKKAEQLPQPGVLVNCCCPGFVSTDMSSNRGGLTPDQGAINPIFIALIPPNQKAPNGEFFSEKELKKWY